VTGIGKTVALCLLFVSVVLAGFVSRVLRDGPQLDEEALRALGAIVLPAPREISPFALRDDSGQAFGLDALTGHWTLLYFGFTYCPDVCPTALRDLARADQPMRDAFAAAGIEAPLQVVMVSVDPERDTPERLREYVRFFDADFIGVTGEHAALAGFATELNAAFAKVPAPEGAAPGEYAITHTGNVAIVNPRGHYHGFLRPPLAPEKFEQAVPAIASAF
jgi:protein SCO1/2